MDPQAALDNFNSKVPRNRYGREAELSDKVDLVDGLYTWLNRGGFKPKGKLHQRYINMLRTYSPEGEEHIGEDAADKAEWINEFLSRR